MMRITRSELARAWRAVVFGTAVLALTAPAYAEQKQVDSVVQRVLDEGGSLPVIVRFKDAAALNRGKGSKLGEVRGNRAFGQARALAAKLDHKQIRDLLANDDVVGVSYDAPVQGNLLGLLTPPPPAVSVEGSGSKVARSRYGVTGSGVTVAVIDSGVKPHTDLPATRIKAFVDFVNGKTTAYDDYGHGTHVAGIVAGSGAASNGQYAGVAPGASIVALKVLDANGAGKTSDVMASLEWVLANHTVYNIRVVNLSLGHPIYEPAATDPLVQLVDRLSQRGIVVVVSAGNMGRNTLGQTVYGTITSPANAQGAIAVGAADTKATLLRSDDSVASFSSRGPTRYDYYVKPDVLAPGYQIASLIASGSTLATKYPNYQIGTSYFRLNGTSQAAPVVAGTAALALQANPALSANTVKGILQFTSQRLRNLDVMTQGAGEVNVAGVVRFAQMVYANQTPGKRWMRTSRKPIAADLLFGETAFWGRALLWGKDVKANSNALYVRAEMWNDNIVWGYMLDNIVWGMFMDENIVWGMLSLDNIVWGMLLEDNIVWGMTDDNIVWGFDDAVSGLLFDNIVWGMDENIVWGASDSVMAFSELLIGMSTEEVDGLSIMLEGEVR
jgi:serine protease AprX